LEKKASGPQPHRLLDHLRPGDVVVVWKLDRLSRSLKDLLHIMEKIGEAGAGFRSLTEHIDTTRRAHDDADGWGVCRVRRGHGP
jgi:DNA invertase Pin-like site-specific DNA recombinase